MINPSDIPESQLILYADDGYDSHVIQLLLAEKQLKYYLSQFDSERPEDLRQLNPYNTLPVLVHRDLSLYELNVIFEYLEDRYHGYKLLPDNPQLKAVQRQLAWRIQNDWLKLGRILLTHKDSINFEQATLARRKLSDALITLAPIFSQSPYFMADEFGWCDVLLGVMLYRLDEMEIELPTHLTRPLINYQKRIFDRQSFQQTINQ